MTMGLFRLSPEALILCAILLLALVLRFWGLDFGLPNLSRPDEQNIANAVFRILGSFATGQPSLNPEFFHYPTLSIYLLSVVYGVYFLIGHLLGVFPDFQAFHQSYLEDWGPFFLLSRGVTALLGTAGVWLLYRLATEAAQSRRVGLIAAGLLAITYLHVRDSHFGVTDIPALLLITACLWRTLLFSRSRQTPHLYQAAVLAGLAASTKYPAGLVAIPVLLAFCFDLRKRGYALPELFQKPALLKQAIILGGLIFGSFLLLSPYILLDYPRFLEHYLLQSRMQFTHVFVDDVSVGWIHHLTFSLWHGLGPIYLLTALASIGWLLRNNRYHRSTHWLLLSFMLVFYLMIGNSRIVFVRYIIPIIPILTLYAAWGISLAGATLSRRTRLPENALLAALLLLVGFTSLQQSFRFNALAAQEDTRTQAANWLLKRLSPGEAVGVGKKLLQVELPPRFRKYQLQDPAPVEADLFPNLPSGQAAYTPRPVNPRNEYKISTYTDIERLRELGIRYVVVGITPMTLYTTSENEIRTLEGHPEAILAARFRPYPQNRRPVGREAYDQMDAFYIPFADMTHRAYPGPEIRIYEIRGPGKT